MNQNFFRLVHVLVKKSYRRIDTTLIDTVLTYICNNSSRFKDLSPLPVELQQRVNEAVTRIQREKRTPALLIASPRCVVVCCILYVVVLLVTCFWFPFHHDNCTFRQRMEQQVICSGCDESLSLQHQFHAVCIYFAARNRRRTSNQVCVAKPRGCNTQPRMRGRRLPKRIALSNLYRTTYVVRHIRLS